MPVIYNTKRVPLPITLRDGSSTSIPAKKTLQVPPELMGSADIARKRRKKVIVVRPDPAPPLAPPAVPLPTAALVEPKSEEPKAAPLAKEPVAEVSAAEDPPADPLAVSEEGETPPEPVAPKRNRRRRS